MSAQPEPMPHLVKKPAVSTHSSTRKPSKKKKAKKDTTKCTRDIRSVPPTAFRLPTDGKKWRRVCDERKALLMLMASYANGDGTNISVAIDTLGDYQGWSRRTTCRLLDSLKTLGFVEDGALDVRHKNTRIRSINIQKVQSRRDTVTPSGVPNSVAGVPDRTTGVPDRTEAPPYLAHNRLQTVSQTVIQTEKEKHGCASQKTLSTGDSSLGKTNGIIPTENYHHLQDYLRENEVDGWREAERDNGALRSLWDAAVGSPDEREERIKEALDDGLSKRGNEDPDGVFSQALWHLQYEALS